MYFLQPPVFRYKEFGGIQPNPLSTFGVPRDILDLATGTDASKLVDLLKLVSLNTCIREVYFMKLEMCLNISLYLENT